MDDSFKIVKLKYPIILASEEITEIKLNRPKAKHLKQVQLQNLTMQSLMQVAVNTSDQTSATIDELDIIDLNKVIAVVTDFLLVGES